MHSYTSPRSTKSKRATRGPRKSELKAISREHAKELVNEFGDLHGLEILRTDSNFTQLSLLKVDRFDNYDLAKAIQFSIDFLSSRFSSTRNPDRKQRLLQRLEQACGPLNKSIILTIGIGYPSRFTPALAL